MKNYSNLFIKFLLVIFVFNSFSIAQESKDIEEITLFRNKIINVNLIFLKYIFQ